MLLLLLFSIIIIRRGSRSPKYAKLDQFTLFEFAVDCCEIIQRFITHVHTTIVPLILILFGDVLVGRSPRSLLKLTNATTNTTLCHDRTPGQWTQFLKYPNTMASRIDFYTQGSSLSPWKLKISIP